jgi:hypothetical protein
MTEPLFPDPPQDPVPEGHDPAGSADATPRRGRVRTALRWIGRFAAVLAIVLAVAIVTTLSVDLGPSLRGRAEQAGSQYLNREMKIGRLSVRLLTGTFVLDDFVIGGLEPGDRPFLTARRLEISMPLSALLHREVLFESIVMRDWRMLVETWPNGRHNFPKFTRESKGPKGPKRFVTTVRSVRALDGQFTFEDHGTPWSTVARNLNVTVRKGAGYEGKASFSDGTVAIQNYLPMRADMTSAFTIDGSLVKFHDLDLVADGSVSQVTGSVDLGRWPEQTWHVRSRVHFPRMREIFFARESWRLAGTGDFTGTFHLFKGGRELKGRFRSAEAGVNGYRFGSLEGALVWLPDRFEVTDATARVYGGRASFDYRMAPLGSPRPAQATFDARYTDVDLAAYTDAIGMRGIRFAGRATGQHAMEWPLGRFSAGVRGSGRMTVTPPAGETVLGRAAPLDLLAEEQRLGREWGPFTPRGPAGHVPIGADFSYRFDPGWIAIGPSRFATRKTYVEFEGRTAWGDRSQIPFHVTSADWQESDRLLVGIMNAFGSSAGAVPVGGWGEFDGVMTHAFKDPRIEGRFSGENLRAWDVVWGAGRGDVVIEDSYVTVANTAVERDGSRIEAEGRFSLGYPRKDGGEEINARVRLTRRPLGDLRHAFLLDDYPVDGLLSGEFHLYGHYETPLGFGRMQIENGVAYGEPFDNASASLRFEGNGVRLDGIEAVKGGGPVTGAAYVGWNGTYSFNVSGRRIPVETVVSVNYPEAPLSGTMEFTASGSGRFDEPRYDVRFGVSDLYVRDEGIGEVTGRLSVRNTTLTMELEAASPRLAVSGTGRIALTPEADAELTFRFTDTSLDPYVRAFEPRLSPFTTAVMSGSLRIVGELRNLEHLMVDGRVDDLQLRLFDYGLHNDGPIRLVLENQSVRLAQMRLVGEDTRLDLSGTVGLADQQLAVHATGTANLGILQGFFRDIRSSGQAELVADIRGTTGNPVLGGSATIAGGRLRHFALPHSLDAINGRITFDAAGATLDGLTARLGGGLVRFGGTVGLAGAAPVFNVTATGEDMRLRYPEGFRSLVNADLALRGNAEALVLSGNVLVKSAVMTRRFEAAANFLELAGSRSEPAPPAAQPTGVPLRFDVRVVAPSSLRIENNVARIVSSADLNLRGTYDKPLLFGRAEIERGEVVFEGRRYVVTRGTVDFSNPARIEPFFDLEAETRVRAPGQTYQVTMNATGTMTRFQWALNSDPPLPNVDILSLLLSNTAPTDPELAQLRTPQTTEQQLLQARAAQLLVSPISAGVGRVVEQTFGVDTFQITPSLNDPTQQSSRLNPGARLTIGKRLSNRAYLTFSQSLTPQSTSRDQIILLEYDQTDRMSWLLSQNEDRTYALEVRVRHTF